MAHVTRREFLQQGLVAGAALAGAGAVTSFLSGCSGKWDGRDNAKFPRTILIGFDGFDPRLLAQYMQQGLTPNFASLANRGVFTELASSLPPMSPVAWSNIGTGCNPGQHGVFDFMHRDPKRLSPDSKAIFLSTRNPVQGLTGTQYVSPRNRDGFWRFTSDAGVPSTVVRFPVTFPAERVEGYMLSGLGTPDILGMDGDSGFITTGKEPVESASGNWPTVCMARWDSPTLASKIVGPVVGAKPVRLPMVITRKSDDVVEILIDKKVKCVLRRKEWSKWVRLSFKAGLRTIHGMVKFLLMEAQPDLKLHMTPINIDPSHQAFDITYPKEYGADLADKVGPFYTQGMPEAIHSVRDGHFGYDEFLAQVEEIDRERIGMLDFELDRFKEGLLSVVFDACDRVQHAFWFTVDPDHPAYTAEKAAKYQKALPNLYQKMDGVLGKVLKHMDNQTALFVISDHGFTSMRRSFNLNRWLVENGFAYLSGYSEKGGKGLLRDFDWSKTKAYALGLSSIYLNLEGREQGGIVKPGDEADRVAADISAKLENLIDPENGERAVNKVYRSSDVYEGRKLKDAPDLIVGMNPGWRVSFKTALGGVPLYLFETNTGVWTGDHIVDPRSVPGILLSNINISKGKPRGLDICPTLLDCLGVDTPRHIDGRTLL